MPRHAGRSVFTHETEEDNKEYETSAGLYSLQTAGVLLYGSCAVLVHIVDLCKDIQNYMYCSTKVMTERSPAVSGLLYPAVCRQ